MATAAETNAKATGEALARSAETNPDATGKEIERALVYNVRHDSNIEIFESNIAIDLLIKDDKCLGVSALDVKENRINHFMAKATILATGGAGRIYKNSSNPKIATGDGYAMAYRAGASLMDMEFVQFHPTALDKKGAPHLLLSETIRGEGGKLLNYKKKRFVDELAPRDVVSRSVIRELEKGPVFLDIRHKGEKFIKKRFPSIYDHLWWYKIFLDKDLIPIAPAAHFFCGGIQTDLNGKTDLPGLFAFGEVARTGVHGANRLASNALLECMVFSSKALNSAKKYIQNKKQRDISLPRYKINILSKNIGVLRRKLQKIMWENVGIIRREDELKKTIIKIEDINKKIDILFKKGVNNQIIELRNMSIVSKLVTESAYLRKKSIGTHYIEKK